MRPLDFYLDARIRVSGLVFLKIVTISTIFVYMSSHLTPLSHGSTAHDASVATEFLLLRTCREDRHDAGQHTLIYPGFLSSPLQNILKGILSSPVTEGILLELQPKIRISQMTF
jgi:hypothetical protein